MIEPQPHRERIRAAQHAHADRPPSAREIVAF